MRGNGTKITFLDIVILILSLYVLIALLADTFFKLPSEVSRLLDLIDNGICAIFLYDFFYRLVKAPSKLKFLKWGWIDLVSSIPAFPCLRYGRLIRLLKILRVLRAIRSVKILTELFKSREHGTFATVSFIAILMIIFGSISILQVEQGDPSSNIKTAGDAIWWAFTTITTVGYGDRYPVTGEGRFIAGMLMITGVGLFGTFTGYVAAWILQGKKEDENK
jgi:voltage-gated potassium channel